MSITQAVIERTIALQAEEHRDLAILAARLESALQAIVNTANRGASPGYLADMACAALGQPSAIEIESNATLPSTQRSN